MLCLKCWLKNHSLATAASPASFPRLGNNLAFYIWYTHESTSLMPQKLCCLRSSALETAMATFIHNNNFSSLRLQATETSMQMRTATGWHTAAGHIPGRSSTMNTAAILAQNDVRTMKGKMDACPKARPSMAPAAALAEAKLTVWWNGNLA